MKIVLGLGFGDEGKGLTTSYLCSTVSNPMVVRFNGGHQAGHTIVIEEKRHVCSSFGAGVLQGVPTYWSKYCTFFPTAFLNEWVALNELLGYTVQSPVYVHPLCPVTTPFDLMANQAIEKKQKHGSVGVGFGTTLKRQESFYKLYVQDLFFPKVLRAKLENIVKYYNLELKSMEEFIDKFIDDVNVVKQIIKVQNEEMLMDYDLVFEGAQGILLDQDFGFFPNVTRSNTTSKNAIELLKDLGMDERIEIFYVTRSYQTRHGNGFMSNECKLPLVNNEKETNKPHEFQGHFRVGMLDTEMLNYALQSDKNFSGNCRKNLVVTCTDQYPVNIKELLDQLNTSFDNVYLSNGDSYTNIKHVLAFGAYRERDYPKHENLLSKV